MARKKEEDLEERNQKRIAKIAGNLFQKYGIEKTQMNDIAKAVDMSKSTLYVYFRNKEEIVNYISLEAMRYLLAELTARIQPQSMDLHDCFLEICAVLVDFKDKYPLSFQLIVEEICVDDAVLSENPVLAEIYEVGENINRFIYICFQQNQNNMSEQELFCLVMELWGSIYGVITLADNKTAYMKKNTGIMKTDFLQKCFENLYENLKQKVM